MAYVSPVKTGSINLPKMMRHLKHRTSQVRELVFMRDPIFRKETKTTGQSNLTEGTGSTLAGPAVNFGYETSENLTVTTDTDRAYHVASPELVIPGLIMLQSPIVSRTGTLDRGGHRITGACTFYSPTLDWFKGGYWGDEGRGNLINTLSIPKFDEFETFDKLIDMERIIESEDLRRYNLWVRYDSGGYDVKLDFASGSPGYEMDRLQFKIKADDALDYIQVVATVGNVYSYMKWDGSLDLDGDAFITIDIPINDVKAGDITTLYAPSHSYGNQGTNFTATITGGEYNLNKAIGDSNNRIDSIGIKLEGSATPVVKDIYIYKAAEWRIESIKEYRDEYMQIGAVRVRGERTSRRRAYG